MSIQSNAMMWLEIPSHARGLRTHGWGVSAEAAGILPKLRRQGECGDGNVTRNNWGMDEKQ